MKNKRFLAAFFLITVLSATRAWAGHVVWVDFSNFDLNLWTFVNGNNPPQPTDLEAIKELIIAKMSEDYATFDITFTTSKPAGGRYTRVKIVSADGLGVFGCAGVDCGGTDIGSWYKETESALVVYAGTFSTFPDFKGPHATTFRIANGISSTASHELGHILGLEHCNAADDWFEDDCNAVSLAFLRTNTKDENPVWHIMSSGESWGLSEHQKATWDRFFSAHSERRALAGAVQLRNHFAPLANVNGGSGAADLVYGRLSSDGGMQWFTRLSSGSDFFNFSEWAAGAGNAGDIFLTGDVDNDGRADLVYGHIESSKQVAWFVGKSNGSGFGELFVWAADAGDAGDIFRLADVDKDGRADLVYGRALAPDTVRWFVRKSNGTSFGTHSIWADDAGDVGDLFFLADADADGYADLVYSRAITETKVHWWVRRSNGSKFGSAETWHRDAGNQGDLMYVGDVTGDGDADLVYGRVKGSKEVTWYFRSSSGFGFGNVATWANDAGNAGDLFRLGDTTGDGKLDLMYGRPLGMTSLTATPDLTLVRWYGRPSQGSSLGPVSTWAADAGNEGDCYP